jgi:hypothetical protein
VIHLRALRFGGRAWVALTLALVAIVATGPVAHGQSGAFTQVASIPGPADLVQVHGNRAYVVGHGSLRIFDITNLQTPRELGSYTFPEKIWGIEVVEPLIYVAADFYGLGILDVSDPAAPRLRGSLKTPGQAKSVAVVGGKAAIADHMSGVDFVDTSNADKPTLLGSYFLEGYAREVAAYGSVAIAVDAPFGVYAFDMTQPGAPEPVHSQQTASAPANIVVSDPKASAPKLAVMVGGGSVQVYDLSKPEAPARLGALKTPSGRPIRAALDGSHAFVADWREGLQVVDLSNPKALRVVASHKTTAQARDVAVAGSHVFVVIGAPSETPREFKDQEVLILKHPY